MRITGLSILAALSLSCGSSTEPVAARKGPMVSIAFDDGYQSTFANGLPVLNRFGYKATFFIIINRAGPAYMSRSTLLQLEAAGHEIGGHTLNHFPMDTASDSQALREMKGGRDSLLSWGVQSVTDFAYPYGSYNSRTPGLAKQAGFATARTVDDGENTAATNPYLLLSPSINDASSIAYVKSTIDKAARDSAWLILTFHRVDENGNSISIRHETLQDILEYVREKGLPVLTIRDAFKRLHP